MGKVFVLCLCGHSDFTHSESIKCWTGELSSYTESFAMDKHMIFFFCGASGQSHKNLTNCNPKSKVTIFCRLCSHLDTFCFCEIHQTVILHKANKQSQSILSCTFYKQLYPQSTATSPQLQKLNCKDIAHCPDDPAIAFYQIRS